jgi:hypothetical protein
MSNHGRFQGQRARTIIGASVVAVALAAAGVLGGVGFAKSSVSAAQGQYGKVLLCHKTKSKKNPEVTINVSQSAVPAHRKHGDTMGACGSTTTTTTTTTSTTTTTTTAAALSTAATSPGKSGDKGKSKGKGPKK